MKKGQVPIGMRRTFVDSMYSKMAENKRIWIITADLGYKMWDEIRSAYGERFVNVGAAEQCLLNVGIGLALEGKIPFVYSITPFLLYRPFESIRNYVNHEKIPVKLVASGRNRDYMHDGFSHWAEEDREIMKIFSNIKSKWPDTNEELPDLVDEMIKTNTPYYLNLKK